MVRQEEDEALIELLSSGKEQLSEAVQNVIPQSMYQLSVDDLIEDIEDHHHIGEREALKRVAPMVNKIMVVHYMEHRQELVPVHRLFSDLKKELEEHFVKEEQLVFPLVKSKGFGDEEVRTYIEELKEEHRTICEILRELKQVTRDFNAPQGACPTFIGTYKELSELTQDVLIQIYKENMILFPKGEEKGGNE
ncbi:MAG TPA: hemerythrin domain-containing protein [Candidatus Pelethocola excrementipullorum]|nr:hemerythrin domain-containing protein [Candidatus Pelethocola excrementipullorum]